MQSLLRDYFSATATGLLIALSLPPFWWHGLIWIAFVPLLAALDGKDRSAGLRIGAVAGGVGYAAAYAWLPPSIAAFFGFPGELVVAAFVAFVFWHALHFSLFGIIVRGQWTGGARIAAPALVWVVVEAFFPTLFPFFIGNALQPHVPFIQLAALTGVAGLSFAILLCNALVFEAWRNFRTGGRPLIPLMLALAVIVGLDLYGRWQLRGVDAAEVAPRKSIVLVQGNVEARRETSEAWVRESLRTYSRLTTEAARLHPDLIVWPELSVRASLPGDGVVMQRVFEIARQADTVLFIGAGNRDESGGAGNAAFLISPYGDVLGVYKKRRMLPFAEETPSLVGLLRGGPRSGALRADTTSLIIPGGRMAPSICYEATFPAFFRDGVNDGADFLVNISNDVWFGDTAGPYHHLQAAVMRAVETRRWLVRATNSGVSAVVDAHGRVVARTQLFERTVLHADVPLLEGGSLYLRWGDWFLATCAAALAALWLVGSFGIRSAKNEARRVSAR